MNINCCTQKTQYPNFKSNPSSPKLLFKEIDFFINMKGYGKDLEWAKKVIEITDKASKSMRRRNVSFDDILARIAREMRKAVVHTYHDSINHTGILRVKRKGYGAKGDWSELATPYFLRFNPNTSPYISYKERFDRIKNSPLTTTYDGVGLTRMLSSYTRSEMVHGSNDKVNSALDKVRGIYEILQEKYISHPEDVTKNSLKEINASIAEIRWILAHATPWERGSDSISNCFMRAMYKAMGIKTYPAAKGVSFDLEAYCTELEDYKKKFATYFAKQPEVIEPTKKWSVFSILRNIISPFL